VEQAEGAKREEPKEQKRELSSETVIRDSRRESKTNHCVFTCVRWPVGAANLIGRFLLSEQQRSHCLWAAISFLLLWLSSSRFILFLLSAPFLCMLWLAVCGLWPAPKREWRSGRKSSNGSKRRRSRNTCWQDRLSERRGRIGGGGEEEEERDN